MCVCVCVCVCVCFFVVFFFFFFFFLGGGEGEGGCGRVGFKKNKGLTFYVNHPLADDLHEMSSLISMKK